LATETVIWKGGWKEGSQGKGAARAVEDQTFEDMCRELKRCEWECSLNVSAVKKPDTTGNIPEKLNTKMNLCCEAGT